MQISFSAVADLPHDGEALPQSVALTGVEMLSLEHGVGGSGTSLRDADEIAPKWLLHCLGNRGDAFPIALSLIHQAAALGCDVAFRQAPSGWRLHCLNQLTDDRPVDLDSAAIAPALSAVSIDLGSSDREFAATAITRHQTTRAAQPRTAGDPRIAAAMLALQTLASRAIERGGDAARIGWSFR